MPLANAVHSSGKARTNVNITMADLNLWLYCDISAERCITLKS